MTPEERQRLVKDLFQAVVDLAPAERSAYLDAHCPDPEARAEVEALLRHHDTRTKTPLQPALQQLVTIVPRDKETELAAFEMLDEFRILRKIGEGGMAVVYLAEDTSLQRLVAVKVLPSAFTQSEERVARFRQEAVTIAQLNHPGIVPVHRVGHDKGVYYLAMDFVEGTTLDAALGEIRRRPRAERLALIRSAEHLRKHAGIVAQVADALDHTHQHDIVHRDVKPSNILLDEQGRPRLTDFGVARNLRQGAALHTGHMVGTYCYMSPEQARARGVTIDRRTDVFSLGVVLYETITLELPFNGETAQEIIWQVISKQPRRARALNPAVSRDLETICHKALEKSPDHRYQTAAHLAADLRCSLEGRPILARPPTVYRKASVWVRDHKMHSMAVLVAALLVMIATLALVVRHERRVRMASVSIRADGTGAAVYTREVSRETLRLGERRELGRTPIEGRLLRPGHYRLTVVAPDGAFAEATCFLTGGSSFQLDLSLRPPDDPAVHQDMVLIEAGTHRFGRAGEEGLFGERSVELGAFWIDRYEVSNAEYLAFTRATSRAEPELWQKFGYDQALAGRPVVGITLEDAQSYAIWKGKRLPTVFEWECAMRAPDGRLLPWGGGLPAGLHDASAEDVSRMQVARWDWGYEEYRRHARDVRSDPQLATPIGLAHGATNVRELTESILFDRSDGVILKGASWIDAPGYFDSSHTWSAPREGVSLKTGFRCARSARP
jgi:serine/threonine protein kinase/formylglycine-generating enzyme required for sulfatase activity